MADNYDVVIIGGGAGRLCRGDPGGAARVQDGVHRQPRQPRRDLPQHRLHSVEGACCNPRRNSPRPGTRWPSTGSGSARSGSTSAAMMARKDKVVDDPDPRRRVPVPQEQGRLAQGQGPHRRAGAGRRSRCRRRRAEIEATSIIIATGSESTPLPGDRHRREAHRLVDRRIVARPRAGAARRHRRRLYRARARLGLAAARRQGDRRRSSRPHRAEHGPRARQRPCSGCSPDRGSTSSSAPRSSASARRMTG